MSAQEQDAGRKAREQAISEGSFFGAMENFDWAGCHDSIAGMGPGDVQRALGHAGHGTVEDFMALISPAATTYLHEMANLSYGLTRKRFGRTISLYVPLYLSNACTNSCVYCGYSHQNHLLRKTLSMPEVEEEAAAIRRLGFEHILLLTGEHPRESGFDYLREALRTLRPRFPQISIEVQPMASWEYEALAQEGLNAVYVYQETYHREKYPIFHPRGRKSDYRWRLETPDRIAAAGVHKVGIGALYGLEDWRVESVCAAMHIRHLQQKYWKTRYAVAFPRLRPHVGSFEPQFNVSDRDLLQLIMAFRLFDQDLEMSLTTRESQFFRDHAFELGITSLSAGSHTEPGGYAKPNKELEQFSINDSRSPEEVVHFLISKGYEPVWKDWDQILQ